jgi:4,4'-diaponeurosporenoate glycosyltransferase
MQGAAAATGSTLVFLDADVRVLADGLAAAVAAQRSQGGLLSVQPYHRMERRYERLSALFNIIAVMGVGVASPRRKGRSSGAFGPCIVCNADDYRAVGGHAAVRNEILEDLALGKVFTGAGLPVHGVVGAGFIEFRMYPEGPGQLVEGWSKNMASGSAHIGRLRMLATVVWVSGAVVAAVDSLQWVTATGTAPWTIAGAMWLLFVAQFGVMLRQLGNFGWWPVVVFAIPLLVFVFVFFNSLWLTVVRRQVRWRGRSVPLSSQTGSMGRTQEA